jgi:hypothetical protein
MALLAQLVSQYDGSARAQLVIQYLDTASQSVAVGQAQETDSAQSITAVLAGQLIAVGQAAETDTAGSVTPNLATNAVIGQASETDTAQTITPVNAGVTAVIGQAAEVDAANSITPSGIVSVAKINGVSAIDGVLGVPVWGAALWG